MKNILVVISIILLAGCSNSKQYNQDITGTWYVYKLTLNNIQVNPIQDTILNDSVTFLANGAYVRLNITDTGISPAPDTSYAFGKWQFQDDYGQLQLTDTAHHQYTFTIFDLTGSSVELLSNGYTRYLRKNQ